MKGTVLCVYFVVPQSAMTEEEKTVILLFRR